MDMHVILITPDEAVIGVNSKSCVVSCGILPSNYDSYMSHGKRISEKTSRPFVKLPVHNIFATRAWDL